MATLPTSALREPWLMWPPVDVLLRQAGDLARKPPRDVPRSHRPLVGGAITRAKRLALRASSPAHAALLGAQWRFNEAAIEAVRSALAGLPAPKDLRALAGLPDASVAARTLLARQRAWNEALVAGLAAAGKASPDEAKALHAPLAEGDRLAPGPLVELLRPQAELNQVLARLLWALLGLHVTSVYESRGFQIPTHLLELTGAGPETWEAIAAKHLAAYAKHAPIADDHTVLEIGCGIGRDAMQLAPLLARGSYVGLDITAPSIEWCRRNVTPRHPNARFFHLDVPSDLYNPGGAMPAEQASFPVQGESADRIVLQSVFTHMFPPAVQRYLGEFHRVLRPDGLAYATLFLTDSESLRAAEQNRAQLRFRHALDGHRVDSINAPEEAVGYAPRDFEAMASRAGLRVVKTVPGSWPGRAADGYQDAVVLARA